jgi:hypothetical protein
MNHADLRAWSATKHGDRLRMERRQSVLSLARSNASLMPQVLDATHESERRTRPSGP